jgi:predicted MFS family arabinose efflux permease
MLAAGPVPFIIARGVTGAGYGLIILPPQAEAVKEGKVAYLFAGVYAGSLCGSSLGAMLADSLGYAGVFGVSAVFLLVLAPLPFLLFSRGRAAAQEKSVPLPAPVPSETRERMRQMLSLARDPAFWVLALCSLIPGSFLEVGLLNFYLPVFLNSAGMTQSDIGRVFLLFCLVIIHAGPKMENLLSAPRHMPVLVFLGGMAGAGALGVFAFLPPTAASLCAAVFLGLAIGCNIPGQCGCLMGLRAARLLGETVSVSILNTLERAGQMLGPICLGLLLTALGPAGFSLWSGAFFGLTSLVFLLYFRPGRR